MKDRSHSVEGHSHSGTSPFRDFGSIGHKHAFNVCPDDICADRSLENSLQGLSMS